MRIYLDCCCLQRPFDDQRQPRIKVEAEAVLAILASVEAGELALLSSEVLEYEVSRTPEERRRSEVLAVLSLGKERLEVTSEVESLAETLESQGISSIDAIHLALASITKADFFGTCDDRLLRKGRAISKLECKVLPILDLVQEVLK